MKGIATLLSVALVAGCAGQLDLAPEAYQANAQTGVPSATDAGAGAANDTAATAPGPGIGSGPPAAWPPARDAAGAADTGGAAGATDAAWAMGAGGAGGSAPGAVDAASLPTPPSACPAGVDALGLLAQRCGGCHGARTPSKNLDLVTPGLADRLVGIKSTCPNKLLLDAPLPGATTVGPPTGHLLDKMVGPVPGCGAQMPYGTPALTPSELDCINEWAARAIARGKK
jgi:hypothetical protein